ncbi:MAG TPA: class I SAM-dependent methyltransferase [Candidatus Dormibacteraeota bacterium]
MTEADASQALTDERFWDDYWQQLKLPVAVDEAKARPYEREILKVLKRFAPTHPGARIVEIGGAPGGYLAYVARASGGDAFALDISPVGCKKLEENFELLGIPVTVFCRDVLESDLSDLPRFDMVYSLGLIEHFGDPLPMIRKHVELAKPGGVIVLGLPNFRGIAKHVLRFTRPEMLGIHNLATMDTRTWSRFEHEARLEVLFRGYVGGWEPRIYAMRKASAWTRFVNLPIRAAARVMDNLGPVHRWNSRAWSGYAMGVYRTPAGD